jgi:uncharacterized protein YgfB (UPF0149 family)
MTLNASILLKRIEQVLDEANMVMHPIEAQAILVGFVAGGMPLDEKSWRKPFALLCHDGQRLSAPVIECLLQVYRSVVNQLANQEFHFQPLLLDEEERDLSRRLDDLALWSQAFITALAMAIKDLEKIPDDIQEMIEDMTAISQVRIEDDASEEAEAAYIELVEYICVVVLNCFHEFGQSNHPMGAPEKNTLH